MTSQQVMPAMVMPALRSAGGAVLADHRPRPLENASNLDARHRCRRSMDLYSEFVCHEMSWRPLDAERAPLAPLTFTPPPR